MSVTQRRDEDYKVIGSLTDRHDEGVGVTQIYTGTGELNWHGNPSHPREPRMRSGAAEYLKVYNV